MTTPTSDHQGISAVQATDSSDGAQTQAWAGADTGGDTGANPVATLSCLALLQQAQDAQTDALTVMLALKASWGDVFSPVMQRKLDEVVEANLRSAANNHRFLQSVTLTEALASAVPPAVATDVAPEVAPTPAPGSTSSATQGA